MYSLLFKTLGGVALLLSLSTLSVAQEKLQVSSYQIVFSIKNAGFLVKGTFESVSFDLQMLANEPYQIKAWAKTQSINTQNKARDAHLRKADYFDSQQYPYLSLESKTIKKIGNKQHEATFLLTIKKIAQIVKIPFIIEKNIWKGSFSINRLDFGVGSKSWILADKVVIDIQITTAQ